MLWQIPMMANVRLEYPNRTRLTPFVGAGVGGVASMLSFGGGRRNPYTHDAEPDGTGSDVSLGFQLFGGLNYRVGDEYNLGLRSRYLATDRQHWDVKWWNGAQFGITADSIKMHSVCLVFSGEF